MVDQSPSGVLVRLPNWYNPPGRSQQWWDIHGQFSWMININVHWFWYLTTKIWCQTCIRGSAYSCKRAEVKQHKWLTKTTPSVSYEQLNSQSYSKFKAWSKHSHNHVAYVFLDLQVAASFSLWALKYLPDTETQQSCPFISHTRVETLLPAELVQFVTFKELRPDLATSQRHGGHHHETIWTNTMQQCMGFLTPDFGNFFK